jgi:UDP-N-acetylmuramoyl-tripeptide--D-alanyl-D-alanine ligase
MRGRLERRSAGPRRVTFKAAAAVPGDLLVAVPIERSDAARRAEMSLERGAWGVLIAETDASRVNSGGAPVIAVDEPQRALQRIARAWRRELRCEVVGITGSAGKTSTKDILAALLSGHRRTHATPGNYNSPIGVVLTILGAERGTEVLIVEMAADSEGGIRGLARIAEPDIAVIVTVGPAHLETFGDLAGVARAKGELIGAIPPGGACVIPADEPLLKPYLRSDVHTLKFGEGGQVVLRSFEHGIAEIEVSGKSLRLELPYGQAHHVRNTLAATAAASALGVTHTGRIEPAFSPLRGELVQLADGITMIRDCYNANPLSVRAALEQLAATDAARRIAVIGGMEELGAAGALYHAEVGAHAHALGVDVLIAVGELARPAVSEFPGESYEAVDVADARAIMASLIRPGDLILIKASRSHRLERLAGQIPVPLR